jgi:HTH-type transcriptional regulator / antitoxin HipB
MTIHSAEQLGQLVRETRKAKGLLQSELALAAGTGRRFVVELEKGKPTAQLEEVLQVLGALGVQVDLEAAGAGGAWRRLA